MCVALSVKYWVMLHSGRAKMRERLHRCSWMAFGVPLGHDDFMLLKFWALQAVDTCLPFVYNFFFFGVVNVPYIALVFFVYILSYINVLKLLFHIFSCYLCACVYVSTQNYTLKVRFCQQHGLRHQLDLMTLEVETLTAHKNALLHLLSRLFVGSFHLHVSEV